MKGKYSGLSHALTVGKPLTKNAKVYIFYLYTIDKTPLPEPLLVFPIGVCKPLALSLEDGGLQTGFAYCLGV